MQWTWKLPESTFWRHPHCKLGNVYASVNELTINFDPCNVADFRQLVTVNILEGNPEIFGLINYIVDVIGRFVKARWGQDHTLISAIVETRLKIFPALGHFQLKSPGKTIINFD